MKPTPINPEAIQAEAQKAAWMFDKLEDACPYPWGSLSAEIFRAAFNTAKERQDNPPPPPPPPLQVVPPARMNRMAGFYEPTTGYQRNNGRDLRIGVSV